LNNAKIKLFTDYTFTRLLSIKNNNMKKLLIISSFLLFSITLFAQPKEGKYAIGTLFGSFNSSINSFFDASTNIGYTIVKQNNIEDEKLFSINLAPHISMMVSKNWMLTGELSINNLSGNDINYSGIGLGGSTRYYFTTKRKFVPFLTLGAAFQYHKYREFYSDNSKSYIIKSGVGCSYFLAENVSLDALFQYSRRFYKFTNEADVNYVSNIGFNFGFTVFFGGKNK